MKRDDAGQKISQHSILIVTDDRLTANQFSEMLESQNYAVMTTGSGDGILTSLEKQQFALVIIDLEVGFEHFATIKKQQPDIEILVITGCKTLDAAITSLKRGANGYVIKPVNADELLLKMEGIIEKRQLISAKDQAEELLQKKNSMFNTLVNDMPVLMFRFKPDGTITFANNAFIEYVGLGADNVVGLNFYDILSPQMLENFKKHIQSLNKSNPMGTFAADTLGADGSFRSQKWTNRVMLDKRGNQIECQSFGYDITDEKTIQSQLEALAQKREELETIINISPAVVFRWNAAEPWQVQYVSDNISQFGYSPEDFYSGRIMFTSLIHEDDLPGVKQKISIFGPRRKRDALLLEFRVKVGKGNYHWVETRIWACRNTSGVIDHYQAVILDITDRKVAETQLMFERNLFNTLMDTIPDAIYFKDNDTKFVSSSRAHAQLFGTTTEDMVGTSDRDYFPEQLAKEKMADDLGVIRSGTPIINKIEQNELASGEHQWVSSSKLPWYDSDGNTIGLIGVSHDVTEEINTSNSLKELAQKREELEKIVNRSPAVAFLWKVDNPWRVEYVSENIQRFGYSPDEFYSESVDIGELIHPDDLSRLKKEITRFRKQKTDQRIKLELRGKGKSGRYHWFEARLWPRENEKGKITHYQSIILDISDRKSAEKELYYKQNLFKVLMDNVPDLIYFKDVNQRYVHVSRSEAELFGTSPENVIGKTFKDFKTGDVVDRRSKDDMQVIRHGRQIINREELIIDSAGRERWFATSKLPWHDGEGKTIGLFGVSRDITDLKSVEASLIRSEALFRMMFENMNACVFVYKPVENGKDFVFTDINRRGEVVEQMPKSDIIGKRLTEMFPGAESFGILDVMREVMKTGEPVYMPPKFYRDDRISGWRENYIYKLETGEIIALCDDVTERIEAEKEMRKLAMAVKHSANLMVITDVQGTIEYVNPKFIEVTGYTMDEVRGENPHILKSGDRPSEWYKDLWDTITSGKEWRGEFRNKRKDGTLYWEWASISPIFEETGEISHFIAIKEDITNRKKVEEEMRIKDKAIEVSISAICMSDILGNIFYVNKSFLQMWGFDSSPQVLGKPYSSLFMDKDITRELYHELKHKGFWLGEHVAKCADGSAIDIQGSVSIVNDNNNKPQYLLSSFQDITERIKAEHEIKRYSEELETMVEYRTKELNRSLVDTQEARDRVDAILKSVGDGLIVTDKYNNIILMNRAAENLLDVRFSEMINRPVEFAIKDETLREKVIETFNKKTTAYTYEFEWYGRGSERPRIMRAQTSVMYDKFGDHTGVVMIVYDVTHEREVDRMKTEFISTAAHELRTPLTSIVGFSKILMTRDDINSEERNRFLSYVHSQGMKLSHIVSDLLDISRIESGEGFTIQTGSWDIFEIISDVLPTFEGISQKHVFEFELERNSILVEGDKEKLEQVVKNILSNAVKYSPDGGTISIRVEKQESTCQVSIADHGIGMTPEQVSKVFEKFYRVDASDSAPEGTGLGMVIVKHIVDAHGGKIWLDSIFRKGTTVMFTVPLAS